MKPKTVIILFVLLGLALAVWAQKKISDYPNTAAVSNSYLAVWARPGVTNYNQSYLQLAAQLVTNQYWQSLPPGYILYGSSARTNAVYISSSGEVLSNAVGKITLAGGTYTSTGAVAGAAMTINTNQMVLTNGMLGIGTSVPSMKLSVNATAVASTAEDVSKWTISDDLNSYFKIANFSGSDAVFAPVLWGLSQASGNPSLSFISTVGSDVGAVPGIIFDARLAGGALSTRPIVDFRSFANSKAIILANGDSGFGTILPNSKLHVAGPIATSVQKGGNATIGSTNSTYLINVNGETATLPTAVGINGRIYTIKCIAPAASGTVATASAAETIDGAASYSLSASNKFVTVQAEFTSGGKTNWWIIGNN